MQYLLNKNHNVVNAGGTIMIKVNLQNIAVNNMLTGQNTLDSIFIDGNSILFITKPDAIPKSPSNPPLGNIPPRDVMF